MRITGQRIVAIVALCVLICLQVGCTGKGNQIASNTAPTTPAPAVNIPAPSTLPTPVGIEPALWQTLTAELERQLVSQRAASKVAGGYELRIASTPPLSTRSRAILASDPSSLRWGFYSNGDYDQNGEVNVADLTPLAVHFKETSLPFMFPVNSIQAVIDGDGNGEINLADVTPIALNFQNTVTKYRVYHSQDSADYPLEPGAENGSATLLTSLDFGSATGDPAETRLQFSSPLPETMNNEYFWVRPLDNADVEGIASTRLGPLTTVYLLAGHVFMAGGGTDPLPGVPIALGGDSTASTTTDENGYYSFEVANGEYSITPSGDPYGYAPEDIAVTILGDDRLLSPIYPAPVDIIHRWSLDDGTIPGFLGSGDLQMDAEGNVYIVGRAGFWGDYRFYLLKYDLFGELVWSRVFNLPYSGTGYRIFLLPDGQLYIAGLYYSEETVGPNNADLCVMKLDSSGNLLWDFAFNYPTSDGLDHFDTGVKGYIDNNDNLHISCRTLNGPEEQGYMLEISPGGILLEQVFFNSTSPEATSMHLENFEYWPTGELLATGRFYDGVLGRNSLLVKMTTDFEIDWINTWSDVSVHTGNFATGPDGLIYHLYSGKPPGNPGTSGVQLARYDHNGVRDWEILCTTEFNIQDRLNFEIGPQGKLWVAAYEEIDPGPFYQINYPFIWSFQQNGDLRFARQWECDGREFEDTNVNQVRGMKVNQYGVVCLTGTIQTGFGEWVGHDLTITDTQWDITHDGFTFEYDELAPLRNLPLTEAASEGTIDPATDNHRKTCIMLYRP